MLAPRGAARDVPPRRAAAPIAHGVNVHAATRVHGNDRAQLARLCRYLGRLPIAEERLTRMADGRLRYELKRTWKDGTRAVLLSPLDLCARVCALISRPGFHMVRYYGCLSSHSALRRELFHSHAVGHPYPLRPPPRVSPRATWHGLRRELVWTPPQQPQPFLG